MSERLDVLELMLQKGGNVHYSGGNTGMSALMFAKKNLFF